MSSQICLKWNSFLNNIATSFESLWEEEGLVDVTLASDGQCLTAHKVILSASSPFFKKVFQTNPCQHPVIILQDVHFSELEALLIFIYKGEVNIEQENLPALLKAAETLQIRGLSGGDIFAKESHKKFATTELQRNDSNEKMQVKICDEILPKKRQKVSKAQSHSILEKALTPRKSRLPSVSESSNSDKSNRDSDAGGDLSSNAIEDPLEMKIEPFEMTVEELQKQVRNDKEQSDRLDLGQNERIQGPGNSPTQELTGLSGLSGITDGKPSLYAYQQLPYADVLPTPDIISTWASSRPMDHLACDLMKILFTPEERILCNVNGKMGKQQFDSNKIHLIREVLLHFSGIAPNSVEWEETWKNCVTKIDTSNRTSNSTIINATHTTSTSSSLNNPGYSSAENNYLSRINNQSPTSGTTNDSLITAGNCAELSQPIDGINNNINNSNNSTSYPPFPCPFCDRAYTSWGFRRRHIKAVHTISPELNCKWCMEILPTHAAWRRHVISTHNLSASDAHNGLLILEEAHMVLQIANPTRLNAIVNIIKQNSSQSQ
ncbi:hypothetical protein PV325_013639 [Microctonus aethiopoides]|nr:hypothetical protein PV326_011207 [Microctonus aethiopoides]KAK0080626.1 hypothetical protein PV325_013639 [Microctonus aethiopoides]